jgi:hypothetical protein
MDIVLFARQARRSETSREWKWKRGTRTPAKLTRCEGAACRIKFLEDTAARCDRLGKTIVPCGNAVEDVPGCSCIARTLPDFAGRRRFCGAGGAHSRNLAKKSAFPTRFFPDLS